MTHPHPNNAFIAACAEFDQLVAHLQTMRADHFGVNAEGTRNWGEVGSLNYANERLRECVRFLSGAEG